MKNKLFEAILASVLIVIYLSLALFWLIMALRPSATDQDFGAGIFVVMVMSVFILPFNYYVLIDAIDEYKRQKQNKHGGNY